MLWNSEIANLLDEVLWHMAFVNIERDMGSFGGVHLTTL